MESNVPLLLWTAASIGCIHTLLGPDHYVPFVALARSRQWSLGRALRVTAVCGVGHVIGSIALGALGIGFGWALGSLVAFEELRGALAGWLLLGFGVAYTAWGIRRGLRNRPHAHLHAHADGGLHVHPHDHHGAHAHPHDREVREPSPRLGLARRWLGPWTVFVIFVLGPCEPLIPLLMVPAANGGWTGVALVALVFAIATISTMLAVVTVGALGLAKLPAASAERWSHAIAGAAIFLCGAAIQFLGL